MKERPILFSAPMVRALLAGTKTETRRVVTAKQLGLPVGMSPAVLLDEFEGPIVGFNCPYGVAGDRLWVREAWDFLPDGGPDEPNAALIRYWADVAHIRHTVPDGFNPLIYGREKVRPSIHMPRWASRITLEVVSVRVERLQDISRGDAMAEGCPFPNMAKGDNPRKWYADLWDQLNGPGAWDSNPWAWVVEFKRIEGPR